MIHPMLKPAAHAGFEQLWEGRWIFYDKLKKNVDEANLQIVTIVTKM